MSLRYQYKWEERQPHIYEGVLFVPPHYEMHQEWKMPAFEELFGRQGAVFIEYCSGNGDWIVERALQAPQHNWIAVEKRMDRVQKIWKRKRERNVANLLITCGEGLTFTKHYLSNESIAGIFVNFPDPWPKQKHAKHRLIQENFVEELRRVIQPGGTAVLATDDEDYRNQMIDQFASWQCDFPHPFYTTQWENYGNSWFERLWKDKGRAIFYMGFRK